MTTWYDVKKLQDTIEQQKAENEELIQRIRKLEAERLHELYELIERQRIALDELLKAVGQYLKSIDTPREADKLADLNVVYKQVSSADAMTGASEK